MDETQNPDATPGMESSGEPPSLFVISTRRRYCMPSGRRSPVLNPSARRLPVRTLALAWLHRITSLISRLNRHALQDGSVGGSNLTPDDTSPASMPWAMRSAIWVAKHSGASQRAGGDGTFEKSEPSPSAIVGCARIASRRHVYGMPAKIAVCTVAMTSPASRPIIVKPRMRSL